HWTNSLTGIKLTPVEALESRRKVDENVAQEIQMSLQTGILSNPNNELSHRMARNNQRQSAAARRARESHEKAAKGPSGKRGKAKVTAPVLSASSSGRVRQARSRTNSSLTPVVLNVPVQPAQSELDNSLTPTVINVPVQPAQSELNNSLTPAMVSATSTQSGELSMPPNAVQPPFDPTFNFDFDFESLLASLENPNTPSSAQETSSTQFSTYDPTIDPTVFGLPGVDSNTLMPSNFSMPNTTDPIVDFMAMYGLSGDAAVSSFVSTPSNNEQILFLPLPPPESPPTPSPAVEHPSEPVKRSRHVRIEVDEANIIHSTRSRAPTARKRFADEKVSDRPGKKARTSKVYSPILLSCSFL
ncbi:hypothetical protein DFH07DRAFT_993004, partial [Mycena maculata]